MGSAQEESFLSLYDDNRLSASFVSFFYFPGRPRVFIKQDLEYRAYLAPNGFRIGKSPAMTTPRVQHL